MGKPGPFCCWSADTHTHPGTVGETQPSHCAEPGCSRTLADVCCPWRCLQSTCHLVRLWSSLANIPLTPETQRDQERRIRREIANSNERRRMQSINAGFQSLKTLIPHTDGEKLSKVGGAPGTFLGAFPGAAAALGGEEQASRGALPRPDSVPGRPQAAILQQTAEYIFSLEQEKTRLLQQNTQLKRFIQVPAGAPAPAPAPRPCPPPLGACQTQPPGLGPSRSPICQSQWERGSGGNPMNVLEAGSILRPCGQSVGSAGSTCGACGGCGGAPPPLCRCQAPSLAPWASPGAERLVPEAAGGRRTRTRASVSPDIWEDEKAEDLRREMIEFRQQLDKERSVRMMLEEQVRSLEAHMYPEKLKVIAQQVQLQQQQEQVRLLHQEKLEREQQHLRTQLLPPPAPTHHPTVIVPAPPPPPSHHINVVTMGPSSVINSVSTSRQNLDTIVQAIQHIEGTQDKLEQEEEQRRAVIVKPVRSCPEVHTSDTASDSEASDSDAMDQSREEPLGGGELP
uniref:Transcription factor AP-4 n=1 Tax=Oryctolagus cuniculus TaxID=9986 RepID=A0A5F9CFI5_RABIT